MNRRHLLAGAAAAPLAALPVAALALPAVNGTDAAWPAYLAAKAATDAAEDRIDAADAALPPEFRSGVPLIFVQHDQEEPREIFTEHMLQTERERDPIIANSLGGPDAIVLRHAYYDRLAAELAEKKAARKEARRHIKPLYARLEELLDPLNDAERAEAAEDAAGLILNALAQGRAAGFPAVLAGRAKPPDFLRRLVRLTFISASRASRAVFAAPLLTLEDAVRKLTVVETMLAEENDLADRVALQVLED